jgi:competence protein ComEC
MAVIIGVFLLGSNPQAWRVPITDQSLAYYNGQKMRLVGWVCEEADVDVKSQRLTICITGKISGQVLVSAKLYPSYDYGDRLLISGSLEAPPQLNGFDYAQYLVRYDIYSVMYYPKVVLVGRKLSGPQLVYRRLLDFKQGIVSIINQSLPEPEAGLANALLLGYRRTVSRDDLTIFARVGLSHLIAISGSHITILSALLLNFLLFLGANRRQALRAILIFLIFYPVMTGLAASAVRASIMGGLAVLAVYYERVSSLIKALVFAAAVMLLVNPQLLRSDIGFQLSFLAILGIIYIYPLGESKTKMFMDQRRWPAKVKKVVKNILDTINLTLVSQLVILPIALISFQQLSLIAPLANILVLWTFSPLLIALIGGSLLAALIPVSRIIVFTPAYFLLKYIFVVSTYLSGFSWSAVRVSGVNWLFGWLYYIILVILVKLLRNRWL